MSSILALDHDEMAELLALHEELILRTKRNSILKFYPDSGEFSRFKYPKHMLYYKMGKTHRQRLFCAANRIGKTYGALIELTYHLTGRYPKWWEGKVFNGPQNWCLAGESWKDVKKVLQDKLLGVIGNFGEGLIPYDCLDFNSMTKPENINTLVMSFKVLHSTGEWSTVTFKSYEGGRESFQGFEGCILLDEEPPLEIYQEALTRTATPTKEGDEQILMMTFTPLKGMSDVINSFMPNGFVRDGETGPGKFVVNVEMSDVPHISEQTRKELEASYHPHVREARLRGIPSLGSGAIYPVPESEYVVESFPIPKHWKRCYGMDVGWNRTAVIWMAQDPDSDVWYGYSEHYQGQQEPSVHAQGILARGSWIPGVIDSAANGRGQDDGKRLMDMYQDLGLDIENADKSVETGLYTCWQLLSSGQFKVMSNLSNFLQEIRNYQRDEKGRIVKKNDHLMDAWRYAIMSGRDRAKNESMIRPTYDASHYTTVSSQYRTSI